MPRASRLSLWKSRRRRMSNLSSELMPAVGDERIDDLTAAVAEYGMRLQGSVTFGAAIENASRSR